MLLGLLLVAACESGAFDVEPQVVIETITLDITNAELVSGNSVVLQADLRDAQGNSVDPHLVLARVEWSSSDAQIATVTALGSATARVAGKAAGSAQITATVYQSVSQAGFFALLQGPPEGKGPQANSSIHVRPASVVQVSGSGQSGTVGTTLPEELVVRAVDENANGVPNVEITFVAVGASGALEPAKVVTGEDGLARSRWTLGDVAGPVTAEAQPHTKYKLAPLQFTATAVASEGGEGEGGEGEAGEGEPASVDVTPGSATLNAVGDTLQLAAVVRDKDGNALSGAKVSWSSKNTSAATVDTTGRVIALKPGRAPILASVSNVVDSAVVDVDQMPASVAVSPGVATLTEGDSVRLSATVNDSNGVSVADAQVVWNSSDTTVATVDDAGLVTAQSAGLATLTAATEGVSGTSSLTVEEPASVPAPSGDVPAFPGAEGWGATALSECRGKPLVVHFVTNTNASGAGSWHDIVTNRTSASNYDIVIFRTGGNVERTANFHLGENQSCLYVAGQTAPGDGIAYQFTGSSDRLMNIGIAPGSPQDIVWRYVRFWSRGNGTTEMDNTAIREGSRIILDHMSIHFSDDAWLYIRPLYGDLRNVTVQNTMMCSAASTGWDVVSRQTDPGVAEGVSLHHLYACHARHRLPRFGAGPADTLPATEKLRRFEVISTMQYKRYGSRTGSFVAGEVDLRDNLLRHDGAPESSTAYWRWERHPLCSSTPSVADIRPSPSIYMSGNTNASGTKRTDWGLMWNLCANSGTVPDHVRRASPLTQPQWPVTATPATQLPSSLLPHVGASKLLACDGSWRDARDPLDAEFVADWVNGTGPTDSNDVVDTKLGWYPSLAAGTPCADADSDGLPDQWEQRFYGSATGAEPGRMTTSGYLVIEHYLNGTDPTR